MELKRYALRLVDIVAYSIPFYYFHFTEEKWLGFYIYVLLAFMNLITAKKIIAVMIKVNEMVPDIESYIRKSEDIILKSKKSRESWKELAKARKKDNEQLHDLLERS